ADWLRRPWCGAGRGPPGREGERCPAPATRWSVSTRSDLLDDDLREVELIEQVDVEGVLDGLPLEVRVRVPVDRANRHLALRPGRHRLGLPVQLVPVVVVG